MANRLTGQFGILTWRPGALVAVAAAAAIGCGPGGAGGGEPIDAGPGGAADAARLVDATPPVPDAGPVAASDLCNQFTTLLCEAEQACCTNAATRYATVAECFAAQNPGCLTDLQALATDPQTGYDPAVARAELDKIAARMATCDVNIGPWFVSQNGLLGVFRGTVASGGDCSPASASDKAPVLSCQSPSVCRLMAIPLSGQCGTPRTQGDSCVTELECEAGLRCEPPETFNGECVARLADGAGCSVNGDCTSLICEASSCVARTADRIYCFKK